MVNLVALAQTSQDADRVLDGRLADDDRLEPALERGVLFDVLPVFVERRRADRVQLATRQHRLQHVRRVHRALRRAGTDDRVQLVDEQDDLSFRIEDFLQDRFQPLLEFPSVLRAGHERAHVQRDDALALETLGHVAADDAAGESFDDGGLADAGLADQHRVVLRAPRQHLNDTTDLFVAADDRVELAAARQVGQIAAVPLESLIRAFGVLGGDALRSADALERLGDRVLRDPVLLEVLSRRRAAAFVGDRDEQVLGAHELVFDALGFCLRAVRHERKSRRQARLRSAVRLGHVLEQVAGAAGDRRDLDVHLPQQLGDDAVGLLDECHEQVLGFHLRVISLLGEIDRLGDRLASFLGEFVDIHGVRSSGARRYATELFFASARRCNASK